MANQKIRIKLKAYEHNLIDRSAERIVETAINAHAVAVIMAHNHPSGIAVPSNEDIQTTQRISAALILFQGDFPVQ